MEVGKVYVASGFKFSNGTLGLPAKGPLSAVTQVVNDHQKTSEWAELFAGLGSWSWSAQRFGLSLSVAVETDDDVCDHVSCSCGR